MLVKLLTSLGSNDFPAHPFKEGEQHEVDVHLGEILVRRKYAIDVTPPPAPKAKAVEVAEIAKPIEQPAKADKFTEVRAKYAPAKPAPQLPNKER